MVQTCSAAAGTKTSQPYWASTGLALMKPNLGPIELMTPKNDCPVGVAPPLPLPACQFIPKKPCVLPLESKRLFGVWNDVQEC